MKRTKLLILLGFILVLLIYIFTTTKVEFSDTPEFISVAKAINGLTNSNIFLMHELLYSLYLALFLKIVKSLFILKFASILWLIATALLYYLFENKKALLLFVTSPLVHFVSLDLTPLIPISFFIALSYLFFNYFEKNGKKTYLVLIGLCLGITMSLRADMIFIVPLFIIIFFFNRSFKEILLLGLSVIPTFSIRLVIDYFYFKLPFYTILTSLGTAYFNNQKVIPGFLTFNWILIPIIIAPFSLLIFKNFREYKKEIIFIGLTLLFYAQNLVYYYRSTGQLRLLMVILPIVIVVLSKIIKQKALIINTAISFIIIILLVYPSFADDREKRIIDDLNKINQEYNVEYAVAGGGAYLFPAVKTDYWSEKGPHYIWSRDYQLFLEDKTSYRELRLISEPRLDADKRLEISVNVNQNRDKILNEEIDELYFMMLKNEYSYDENLNILTILWPNSYDVRDVELIKCYSEICLFKKINV